MDAPSNILVVAPAWVGDMVMAQSLFIRLKQLYPAARLDVLAPSWTLPLLSRIPEVQEAIELPFARGRFAFWQRMYFGRKLRSHRYDLAILLPNTWKSALIPYFAKIPQRRGYIGESRFALLNDMRKLDKEQLKMTVQRFVALAEPETSNPQSYPQPRLLSSAAQQHALLDKLKLQAQIPLIALCPGAEYGPAKQWPANYYAELAVYYRERGYQICLLGSPKDRDIATKINTLSGHACLNYAGLTSLLDAIDLLAFSQAVVSNDSGLMHVAAALDKPLIALYGSSDPEFTPPLNPSAQILHLKLECSPCFKRECPLGHLNCLNELKPEAVIEVLNQML